MPRRRKGQIIDKADARIVARLASDGRTPNVAIAKSVGLSETAVRRRLERLLRENVASVRGQANPETLGYGVNVVLSLEVDSGQAEDIGRVLVADPHIRYASLTLGDYGLVLLACFRTHQEMREFVADRVRRLPGVHRCQVNPLLRVLKSGTDWGQVLDEIGRTTDTGQERRPSSRRVSRAASPARAPTRNPRGKTAPRRIRRPR